MKRIISVMLIAIMITALAAGCDNSQSDQTQPSPTPTPPPVSPSPTPSANGSTDPDSTDPDPGPDTGTPTGPIMISAAELSAIINDDNVILIGAINPTAALVPFSNASNPVRGSFLVWNDDFYGSCPEALSPNLANSRIPLHDMETLLSKSGATADSIFVVYASDAQAVGARVAWHLSLLGLNVRFLDGGVAAWRANNGRTGSSRRLNDQSVKNDFKAPNYDPSINNASIDVVIEALQNPSEWVVIDTRSPEEYNGDRVSQSSNAYGTGRMKGAVNINWVRNYNSDELLLPEAELRELYNFIGDRKVITYCQGGVRSSYAWIVLKDLGFDVRNYDGSWIEWSYAASSFSDYQNKDVVLSLTESWSDNNGKI